MNKELKWSRLQSIKAPLGAALLALPLAVFPMMSSNISAIAASSCSGRLIQTLKIGNKGRVSLYSNGRGKCVITVARDTSRRKYMRAYIVGQADDRGYYYSYAGPVNGRGRCVTWGGEIKGMGRIATTCAS
jgi:hypothetical protein